MTDPNKAHTVDAPFARPFPIVHPWGRATDARRWRLPVNKRVAIIAAIAAGLLLVAVGWVLFGRSGASPKIAQG